MIIHIDANNLILEIHHTTKDDIFISNLMNAFPSEFIEIDDNLDVEVGDKYIDGEVVKPSFYFARLDENNIVIETFKAFDKESHTSYVLEISLEEYELLNSEKTYKYKDNSFEEYVYVSKEDKLKELETFINNLKEQGFYYSDNRFKLDAVAQNRINMLATNVSLTQGVGIFPLQWFTANGENGTITLNDVNEFSAWYTQATYKIMEIEQKEVNYRYMIEQAKTEEELNNIIFK